MPLRLPSELRDRVCNHLQGAYPEEGCGFLLGSDGPERVVRHVIEATNRSPQERARRFVIAPEEFLAAETLARRAGFEVLGFYHSHPDHPARPSRHDAESAWPWYSYLIVAVRQGRAAEIASWRSAGEGRPLESEPLILATPQTSVNSQAGEA